MHFNLIVTCIREITTTDFKSTVDCDNVNGHYNSVDSLPNLEWHAIYIAEDLHPLVCLGKQAT